MRRTLSLVVLAVVALAAPSVAAGAPVAWHHENEAGWPGGPSPFGTVDADIDASEAWAAARGDGALVAVLDTGVDARHPLLQGALAPGWDFVDDDADPDDEHGHGTHVAGTIAARAGGGAVGGVAPAATVMPLRVLDATGDGSSGDLARAIRFAARRGARVISLSIGYFSFDRRVAAAVQLARRRGAVVVAAAGNGGENLDREPVWPASYRGVVAVGCSNADDRPCPGTAHGRRRVLLYAPGEAIRGPERGGGEQVLTGTSQAAAVTSAVAALALSARPTLSGADLERLLGETSDRRPWLAARARSGGRLNAAGMVRAAARLARG